MGRQETEENTACLPCLACTEKHEEEKKEEKKKRRRA